MTGTAPLPVPREEFLAFLVAAHQHGYAGQSDEASVTPLLPGSSQLEYRDGRFIARDIYVGSVSFVGQEIIYYGEEPMWAMCYVGGIVDAARPSADADRLYAFLRSALRAVTLAHPYRGPAVFRQGELVYLNVASGDIESFQGVERIIDAEHEVYRLHYAGGVVG